ncbi:MAG TPA: tRNA lysidine(34) synthetase TilS [Symbiobacteriaceae bacterium]|nr:tRNA lysidine(34) synthetase TilS [Symbiobacteriaceae bacterium]
MLEQVRTTIARCGMVSPGDKVIVAVSGGPDSTALLHVLRTLAPDLGISLHVFHMDHGLRGANSAADAACVKALADKLSLPCTVVTLPSGQLKQQGGSLQANARQARYNALATLAAEIGASRVAYGHNRDDQAETVLMRFLRGAGARGLAGMPAIRRDGALTHIRPLLGVARREIEEYCRERELFPRVDESNMTPAYLRNRLRLELLPHLAATYNPAIAENLAQLASVMREEDEFLDTLATEAFERCRGKGEGIALGGRVLLCEPLAVRRRVVRLAARLAAGPDYDLGLGPVTRVLDAAARTDGTTRVDLPGGLEVLVEYGTCRFLPAEDAAVPEMEWPVAVTGSTIVPELGVELTALPGGVPRGPLEAAFQLNLLPGPLTLRRRRPGDRIWPTGMPGSKKVQDLLVDAKVPKRLRDRVPILVSGDEVIWVVGHRLDRRFLAHEPGKEGTVCVSVKPLFPES